MEEYQLKIRREVCKRDIQFLCHFTRIENLASIVEYGLIPRTALDGAAHPYLATDNYRLDGRPNTISLSISDVNYPMFASKRKAHPSARWVVLLLDPAVLWSKTCRFCERSAASKEMASKRGAQAGAKSFRYLFMDDYAPFPARNDAEVLVSDPIEPSYICGAWTDRGDIAPYVQGQLDKISGEDLTTFHRPFDPPGLYG